MKETLMSSFMNVLFFAIFVGAPTFSNPEFSVRAFGEKPFGIPVTKFVFLMMAILYVPFVPAVCGMSRFILVRTESDIAVRQGNWAYVAELAKYRPPALKWIRFGAIYGGVLFALWIAWTTYKGI